MGFSRTVLNVEDSSRTKNYGLGLGLEDHWPWLWPLPQVSCKLQLVVRTKGLSHSWVYVEVPKF